MPCYGVDTTPIDRMSDALARLEIDLLDLGQEQFAAYALERRQQLRTLVELYLDMIACFFGVMRAVAARTLFLERDAAPRLPPERQVDRTYLDGFLPLYDRASEQALRNLRQVLMGVFANAPELQATFVAQMAASETVAEAYHFSSAVRTADSPTQAQEHGKSGKEIVDSVKDFLKGYLNRFVKDKNIVHKVAKTVLRVDITKAGIEQSLHVINEVLRMVFPGRA